MLTDLDLGLDQGGDEGEEGEGMVRFGVEDSRVERLQREGEGGEHDHKEEVDYKDVDWEEMVPGTKRVLSMDVSTPLFSFFFKKKKVFRPTNTFLPYCSPQRT